MSDRETDATTGADDAPASELSERAEQSELDEGLIVDGSRGLYRVRTARGDLLCTIRGRLRKELTYTESASARKRVQKVQVKEHDPVAVGDRVRALPTGGGRGVIEQVVARAGGAFARRDPAPGHQRLTTVSGLDQMVAVFAARDPEPHLGLLDRFLVVAESQGIEAVFCLNKVDLGVPDDVAERLAVYRRIGYPVLLASTTTGAGIEALRVQLVGRISALVGPSGVGKSSLLNALEPDLAQRVSAISEATGRGRHTTTGTRLCALAGPGGGYLADTAGIRALALDLAAEDRLDWCFRELRPYLGRCRLPDCTHLHEPGCAVRAAVSRGEIDRLRFRSYRRLRGEEEDN